nr:hypothetical protein [uncultured Acetobacter sp.]
MSGLSIPPQRTLLTAFCLALSVCGGSAGAATSLKSRALVVHTPCLQSLHIVSNRNQSEVASIAGKMPQDITLATGADGVTTLSQNVCTQNGSLTVSTRPDVALTIDDAGSTNITVEDRTGTVFVHAGSGAVALGKTGELGLFSASSGSINISTLAASARIRSEQSAPITIAHIAAPALALYLGGSASFNASSGQLKALEITSNSTGDAIFRGITDAGMFHVQQSGNISVDKVTGALATERDGSGKIISDAATPAPRNQTDRVNVMQ